MLKQQVEVLKQQISKYRNLEDDTLKQKITQILGGINEDNYYDNVLGLTEVIERTTDALKSISERRSGLLGGYLMEDLNTYLEVYSKDKGNLNELERIGTEIIGNFLEVINTQPPEGVSSTSDDDIIKVYKQIQFFTNSIISVLKTHGMKVDDLRGNLDEMKTILQQHSRDTVTIQGLQQENQQLREKLVQDTTTFEAQLSQLRNSITGDRTNIELREREILRLTELSQQLEAKSAKDERTISGLNTQLSRLRNISSSTIEDKTYLLNELAYFFKVGQIDLETIKELARNYQMVSSAFNENDKITSYLKQLFDVIEKYESKESIPTTITQEVNNGLIEVVDEMKKNF